MEVECPYCEKKVSVSIEDMSNGDESEKICPECKKEFGYMVSISVTVDLFEIEGERERS